MATSIEVSNYEIVFAGLIGGLENLVRIRLSDGWELYGYPFANERGFYQAMIKYNDEPPTSPKPQRDAKGRFIKASSKAL